MVINYTLEKYNKSRKEELFMLYGPEDDNNNDDETEDDDFDYADWAQNGEF